MLVPGDGSHRACGHDGGRGCPRLWPCRRPPRPGPWPPSTECSRSGRGARRPHASHARPLASVLRDVEAAIARGDVAGGRAFLREAESTGRLTLLNRSLLEVRLVALESDAATGARLRSIAPPGGPSGAGGRPGGGPRGLRVGPPTAKVAEGPPAVLQEHDQAGAAFGAYFVDHRRATSRGSRLAWAAHYARVRPRPSAAISELLDAAPVEERPLLEAVLAPDDAADETRNPGRMSPRTFAPSARTQPPGRRRVTAPPTYPRSNREQALAAAVAVGDPVRRDETLGRWAVRGGPRLADVAPRRIRAPGRGRRLPSPARWQSTVERCAQRHRGPTGRRRGGHRGACAGRASCTRRCRSSTRPSPTGAWTPNSGAGASLSTWRWPTSSHP